jgi:hypothetical protein
MDKGSPGLSPSAPMNGGAIFGSRSQRSGVRSVGNRGRHAEACGTARDGRRWGVGQRGTRLSVRRWGVCQWHAGQPSVVEARGSLARGSTSVIEATASLAHAPVTVVGPGRSWHRAPRPSLRAVPHADPAPRSSLRAVPCVDWVRWPSQGAAAFWTAAALRRFRAAAQPAKSSRGLEQSRTLPRLRQLHG